MLQKVQSGIGGKECVPCSFPSSFTEDADFPVGIFGIYINVMTIQLAAVPDILFLFQSVDDGGCVQVAKPGLASSRILSYQRQSVAQRQEDLFYAGVVHHVVVEVFNAGSLAVAALGHFEHMAVPQSVVGKDEAAGTQH